MTPPNEALKAWRGERTVISCAKEVGVAHPTWLDWEAGKKRPRIEHAIKIAKATGGAVPIDSWVLVEAEPDELDGLTAEKAG